MRINGANSQTGVKYICWVLESESMANSHGGPKHGSLAHSSTMCNVRGQSGLRCVTYMGAYESTLYMRINMRDVLDGALCLMRCQG